MEKGRFFRSSGRLIWTLFLCTFATAVYGQIRVKEPIKDLGDVFEKSGEVTVHFQLENPYRQDTIRIRDIVTSCGCTAALAEDTIIMPGSSIQLDVVYDPSNRPGLFVKSIELSTRNNANEQHKFYLKIMGNVLQESFQGTEVNGNLEKYQVAPLYFYPITLYDTSYFQLSYISSFVDDMTYEIDYYQFTTIGMEVEVRDMATVERMEPQLSYLQNKIHQEFSKRGYAQNTVFFDEPHFSLSDSIPVWANGTIRLSSVNFDAGGNEQSEIIISETERVETKKMLLDYERFALPEIAEIIAEVNFESIESRLFINGELDLEGKIVLPWKKSDKIRHKTVKKLKKALLKEIKKRTGAKRKNVRIEIDHSGIHPANKYLFQLWDKADREPREELTYHLKPEQIQPPFLPTYRQIFTEQGHLDTLNEAFVHFWENLIRNARQRDTVHMILECGYHLAPDSIPTLKGSLKTLEKNLVKRLKEEAGAVLMIEEVAHASGLQRIKNIADGYDDAVHNYINLIPLLSQQPNKKAATPSPYKVNFDLFFIGVDKGAFAFQRFTNELAAMVQKYGYVALRIESSASWVPIADDVPNEWVAFQRLIESEKRLKTVMAEKMIDPNRVIFIDESVVVQGPKYDGSMPILRYRDYHYVQIIPEKYLQN